MKTAKMAPEPTPVTQRNKTRWETACKKSEAHSGPRTLGKERENKQNNAKQAQGKMEPTTPED